MAKGNDGHGQQLWPLCRQTGQDQKYFPLGTSKAKSGLEAAIRKENEKFRNGLIKLLGSEQAADAYIKHRPQTIKGTSGIERMPRGPKGEKRPADVIGAAHQRQ